MLMTGVFTVLIAATLYICFLSGGCLAIYFAGATTLGYLTISGVFEITNGISLSSDRVAKMSNIKFS